MISGGLCDTEDWNFAIKGINKMLKYIQIELDYL